jgi:hypothetical protein
MYFNQAKGSDSGVFGPRKAVAELMRLVLDSKLSLQDARNKWPGFKGDVDLDNAFRILCHFEAAYKLRDKNQKTYERQAAKMRKLILHLEQDKTYPWEHGAYIWTERLEKPLLEVDDLIKAFAKKINGRVASNWRDAINRIVFWREWRVLKFIRIGEFYDDFDDLTAPYLVDGVAIQLLIPSLGLGFFSALPFDYGLEDYVEDIGILESPIDREKLLDYLDEAYQTLKPITRADLKQKHKKIVKNRNEGN